MKQWFLGLLLCNLLISCGQSGKLYLPKPAPDTTTAPYETTH